MIPFKLIGYGALVLAIVVPIGLHIHADNKKDRKIDKLYTEITTLESEKTKLVGSNESLENTLARVREETNIIIRENERFRNSEHKMIEELASFKEELNSKERKARIDKIIAGRKASLLLRITNSQAACEWKHFGDFDGKCVAGKWKDARR